MTLTPLQRGFLTGRRTVQPGAMAGRALGGSGAIEFCRVDLRSCQELLAGASGSGSNSLSSRRKLPRSISQACPLAQVLRASEWRLGLAGEMDRLPAVCKFTPLARLRARGGGG